MSSAMTLSHAAVMALASLSVFIWRRRSSSRARPRVTMEMPKAQVATQPAALAPGIAADVLHAGLHRCEQQASRHTPLDRCPPRRGRGQRPAARAGTGTTMSDTASAPASSHSHSHCHHRHRHPEPTRVAMIIASCVALPKRIAVMPMMQHALEHCGLRGPATRPPSPQSGGHPGFRRP